MQVKTRIASTTPTTLEHTNIYEILAQQRNGTEKRDDKRHSFGSVSGAKTTSSGSKENKGRDPIPMITVILHLLDRMKPDKVKQSRLLTNYSTRQRLLPSAEQKPSQQSEKERKRKSESIMQ
jgi:hypothetical protein